MPTLLSSLVLPVLLATAGTAQDPPTEPPMSELEVLPVVPGTEALDLGDPDAPAGCLLVHGFAGSRKDFADLGERLVEAGCRVQLLRLPGHGTTPEDMESTSPEELIEHVRQATRQLRAEHEQVVLIGFSMGGAISTVVAAEEQVDRLVLVAPCFEIQHQWYYLQRPEEWAEQLHGMVRWVPKTEGTIQVNRPEGRAALFSYTRIPTRSVITLATLGRMASEPAVLGALDMPVLILHSPGDFAASQAASAAIFPQIASAGKRYVEMDARNNHHLLSDWDRERVKAEILDFVQPSLGLAMP